MRKACRNRPLSERKPNATVFSKTRYVVEQASVRCTVIPLAGTYFGLIKVSAQSHLKAMCLNLLKAANRLNAPAAA
ncbi:putative transposase [Neisseria meningitidis NM95]|nr:putative transposase [Neisseria meningitidis NM95]